MTRASKLNIVYLLTLVAVAGVGFMSDLPTWQGVLVGVLAMAPIAATDIYFSTRPDKSL